MLESHGVSVFFQPETGGRSSLRIGQLPILTFDLFFLLCFSFSALTGWQWPGSNC